MEKEQPGQIKTQDILKEAVIKLKLPIGVYIDASKYSSQLQKSETNLFSNEVLESACIYLATKVNEQFRRIRGKVYCFCIILRYTKCGIVCA